MQQPTKESGGCCGGGSCGGGAKRKDGHSGTTETKQSCCGDNNNCNSNKKAQTQGTEAQSSEQIYTQVQSYYGKVLQSSKDLKTSSCCTLEKPHIRVRNALKNIPDEIMAKYYGCGNPLPFGIDNLTVLDLGSGSGRDCYLATALVGPKGSVIGVDFTDEQLAVARKYVQEYTTKTLGYPQPNLRFIKGYIEFLSDAGIANNSVDIIISNCVVNLSPDKKRVLAGAYAALREGGEFYFSDVYCDRRLSSEVRKHEVLWGECIAGAMYIEDFKRTCHEVGFKDPRVLTSREITIDDEELKQVVGNARFYSITYRLFKLPQLESLCEDYGQVAVYKGTIPEYKHSYALDDHHVFVTNKPTLVCGNTASMVGESWLAPHFQITGDRSVHYGLFPCGPTTTTGAATTATSAAPSSGGSCC